MNYFIKHFQQFIGTMLILMLPLFAMAQGVTTSTMSGRITDGNTGEALIGANVLVIHTSSGTTYGNSTDVDGFYRIHGMRVGGPYTVTVSYTGYEDFKQEGIFLTLGQTFQLNTSLKETAVELDAAVITATRSEIFDGNRTGQETVVDERTINNLPTVSRALADYARFNPLASIGENTDGFTVSLGGQNNRYNTIYIDGAVNNDVFGLAGSGTNGGQTGVQPVSIDAIEQFQIALAPFDVRQSGFAGGTINAVTRSGTNDFEGSVYYFFRNESLTRRDSFTNENNYFFPEIPEYTAKTYGFRLGGPIIKNKLFFFVNGEIQRDDTPKPFDISGYDGNSDAAAVDQLRSFVSENYNYDMGVFDNNTAYLYSDKILAKLDWNISQNHKLSLRHSFVKAENLEARSSSSGALNFLNGSEYFNSTTNSSALELTSLFGNNMSNNLKIGATLVRDDRDPLGNPFPTVVLQDGEDGRMEFGAERFSTANLLNQDVITINNDFQIFKGRHSWLFGVNFEYFNAGNLFIRENYGTYNYFNQTDADGNITETGVERFLAGAAADQFDRSFSQVDNVTGDDSEAIARVKQSMLGAYIQDEMQLTDRFKVTAGIRVDVPIWGNEQPLNAGFNDSTIAKIEAAGYDMQGAKTGQFIKTSLLFSPRIGFNLDVTGDRSTQLRGGIGIFTSRIPLVWPGGAYNNFGFNIGGTRMFDSVVFNPDVNSQEPGPVDLNDPSPSGQIDLFAEDFKLPQAFKANLAIDHKLPGGLVATLEGIYTKNFNNVYYQNLNLVPSATNLVGADDRPLFGSFNGNDNTYGYIMLASNTNKGYAYNAAFTLSKSFNKGFSATASYAYGDAFSVLDATSSQNNSQWRGYYNVNGRNEIGDPMRSTFSQGSRVIAQAAYEFEYLNFGRTNISLFFNGQSGQPFTYVVGSTNRNFVNDGGFDFNEQAYIPASRDEITLVESTVSGKTYSPDEQWAILDKYISDDNYLSENRGSYAERNATRLPFQVSWDLRVTQDFFIEMANGKRNTLQLSMDLFNLGNLINKEWGHLNTAGFGTYSLVNLRRIENGVPQYTVSSEILEGEDIWIDAIDDSGFRSSRWQMQLGVRYIFE